MYLQYLLYLGEFVHCNSTKNPSKSIVEEIFHNYKTKMSRLRPDATFFSSSFSFLYILIINCILKVFCFLHSFQIYVLEILEKNLFDIYGYYFLKKKSQSAIFC